MITASLKNIRISPRKVRLVADMVRGKNVAEAKIILAHASKKAKLPLADLVDSAVANASHNHKIGAETLFVKEIRVDQGLVMKRFMPVSRGSAHGIKKRTSHVTIVLDARTKPESRKSKVRKVATSKSLPNAKKDL